MLAHVGREGGAGGLEDPADLTGNHGTGRDALAVLFDGGLLEAVEIAQQIAPFDGDLGGPALTQGSRYGGRFRNAHYRRFLRQQLAVAWDRPLTAEPEGPSFISRTVARRSYSCDARDTRPRSDSKT